MSTMKRSICINGITFYVIIQENDNGEPDCIVVNEHDDIIDLIGTDEDDTHVVHPFIFNGTTGGKKGAIYFKDENDFVYDAKLSKVIGRFDSGNGSGRGKGGRGLGKAKREPHIRRL
jgi:hypothetical protein